MACTLAQSALDVTSRSRGAAARKAEAVKRRKYRELANRYVFTPVAFETLGVPGEQTATFLNELGRRLAQVTGDRLQGEYLWQRASLCIQRGNAASILLGLRGTGDIGVD